MLEIAQFSFDFNNDTETGVIEKPVPRYSKRDKKNFMLDIMDMLSAPIITFPGSFVDAVPYDLKENIRQARMISALKKEYTATIPEVAAYLMTRSLESPIHYEWANIYLWCSAQYMTQYKGREYASDIGPRTLNDYEQSQLKRLRDWIYEKRRKYVKQRLKDKN